MKLQRQDFISENIKQQQPHILKQCTKQQQDNSDENELQSVNDSCLDDKDEIKASENMSELSSDAFLGENTDAIENSTVQIVNQHMELPNGVAYRRLSTEKWCQQNELFKEDEKYSANKKSYSDMNKESTYSDEHAGVQFQYDISDIERYFPQYSTINKCDGNSSISNTNSDINKTRQHFNEQNTRMHSTHSTHSEDHQQTEKAQSSCGTVEKDNKVLTKWPSVSNVYDCDSSAYAHPAFDQVYSACDRIKSVRQWWDRISDADDEEETKNKHIVKKNHKSKGRKTSLQKYNDTNASKSEKSQKDMFPEYDFNLNDGTKHVTESNAPISGPNALTTVIDVDAHEFSSESDDVLSNYVHPAFVQDTDAWWERVRSAASDSDISSDVDDKVNRGKPRIYTYEAPYDIYQKNSENNNDIYNDVSRVESSKQFLDLRNTGQSFSLQTENLKKSIANERQNSTEYFEGKRCSNHLNDDHGIGILKYNSKDIQTCTELLQNGCNNFRTGNEDCDLDRSSCKTEEVSDNVENVDPPPIVVDYYNPSPNDIEQCEAKYFICYPYSKQKLQAISDLESISINLNLDPNCITLSENFSSKLCYESEPYASNSHYNYENIHPVLQSFDKPNDNARDGITMKSKPLKTRKVSSVESTDVDNQSDFENNNSTGTSIASFDSLAASYSQPPNETGLATDIHYYEINTFARADLNNDLISDKHSYANMQFSSNSRSPNGSVSDQSTLTNNKMAPYYTQPYANNDLNSNVRLNVDLVKNHHSYINNDLTSNSQSYKNDESPLDQCTYINNDVPSNFHNYINEDSTFDPHTIHHSYRNNDLVSDSYVNDDFVLNRYYNINSDLDSNAYLNDDLTTNQQSNNDRNRHSDENIS